MHFQVIYCNHHSAELSLRERLAFSTEELLSTGYQVLRKRFPLSESVVISTCNRMELYTAHAESEDSPSREDLLSFLADFHHIPNEDLVDHLLSESGADAIRHLFEVASSLDSMVLGEPQIVSQVKAAYEQAQTYESCGPLTHLLFQGAIRVSSRVRSETRLAEGRISIASVAVGDFASSIFERFDDKQVLILGAGEMAEETLRYLKDEGVNRISVLNRNLDRAEKLACQWGGEARSWDCLENSLLNADVIVSTTGATSPIVSKERFQAIRRQSRYKPVFILDLGAPRDFDPEIGDLDENVFLYDIDDLEATCEENRLQRTGEISKARQIVEEETIKFLQDINHRATGPIVRQLREGWHSVKQAELEKLFNKLSHLSETEHKQIEKTVDQIINKLLHPPLEVLRSEAKTGTPHGLLEALKRLFHLQD